MYAEIQAVLTEISDLVKVAETKQALGDRWYFIEDLTEIKLQIQALVNYHSA